MWRIADDLAQHPAYRRIARQIPRGINVVGAVAENIARIVAVDKLHVADSAIGDHLAHGLKHR